MISVLVFLQFVFSFCFDLAVDHAKRREKGKCMRKFMRLLPFRLAVVTMVLALPAGVQAQFGWTTNKGTITITEGCSGPTTAVSIPASINGLAVTRIGNEAFASCLNLTSVTIPDSVTSIGDGASNLVVVVEARTSLASPTWSPLATNTLTGSSLYFSDAQWTNYPARFYRLTMP